MLGAAVLLLVLGARAAQPGPTPHASNPLHELFEQLPGLIDAAFRLPLAALFGGMLAFRPRSSGTPARRTVVIQTQILLSIVGALVMVVVGQSLARAFGIVGVASLVRYRAKVSDPKDAGVMLACLGIGLACGVGLYLIAGFATVFLIIYLRWVESLEPEPVQRFQLAVAAPDPEALRTGLERLLRRHRAVFELRTLSDRQISYEVALPLGERTDTISSGIAALNDGAATAVEWEDKKDH